MVERRHVTKRFSGIAAVGNVGFTASVQGDRVAEAERLRQLDRDDDDRRPDRKDFGRDPSGPRQTAADDSIERLRAPMAQPAREDLFSQLAVEQGAASNSRRMADRIPA